MSFTLPTPAQLRQHGDALGIELSDGYIDDVIDYLQPMAGVFDLVGSLPDDLPPVKYARTPGQRPETVDNPLGAWYVKTSVAGATRGKLKGRKVALKDTICLAGVPMMNGASVLEGYVPEIDATVATRLLDAGAEIVGKTVCEYFSASGGCVTAATGPVTNPRKPGYSAGGSSSGSAAVVANGEVDMAMGGDQAGSIRIPASYCGVVGLKPTFGLVPYTGIMGLDPTIDHIGPMTRTVADNALFLEVLAGPTDTIRASAAFAPPAIPPTSTTGSKVCVLALLVKRSRHRYQNPRLTPRFGKPPTNFANSAPMSRLYRFPGTPLAAPFGRWVHLKRVTTLICLAAACSAKGSTSPRWAAPWIQPPGVWTTSPIQSRFRSCWAAMPPRRVRAITTARCRTPAGDYARLTMRY